MVQPDFSHLPNPGKADMSVDTYRRAVVEHRQKIARLQQEKAREAGRVAEETRRANSEAESAGRATSESTVRSKLREVQRHQANAAGRQKKVADIEAKIATEQGRLNDDQRRLADAEAQEERRRAQQQKRADREHQSRMTAITGKLTHHDQLHTVALSAIKKNPATPRVDQRVISCRQSARSAAASTG